MKQRPFIVLLSVLLCLFLFPVAAMGEEVVDVSAPPEMSVNRVEEDDDTLAIAVGSTQIITQEVTQEEPVKSEATPLVVDAEIVADEAGQELDGPTPVDTDASATHIEPAEYIINVDSAEYTIRYSETELYLSGKNILLENGVYNYALFANTIGRMIFDNDLEIIYQDVNGKYSLHYDMVDREDHTMVADGKFDNLLKASPLLKRKSDRISDDSYSYQLALWTKEGFTFTNALGFTYDGNRYDYSMNYHYDLATNEHTLVVEGLPEQSCGLRQKLQSGKARLINKLLRRA